MKNESSKLILECIVIWGLAAITFVFDREHTYKAKDAGMSETIALLDTVYTESTHNRYLYATYLYEVNGQTYRCEHKITTALPRGFPMAVYYYKNNPSHASAVTNKPLLCSIGGERYYVTYISKRVVLKKAAKQFPSIVPLREPIDSIQ